MEYISYVPWERQEGKDFCVGEGGEEDTVVLSSSLYAEAGRVDAYSGKVIILGMSEGTIVPSIVCQCSCMIERAEVYDRVCPEENLPIG
jgi:hypothetical protein